jgi:hypothetical protein
MRTHGKILGAAIAGLLMMACGGTEQTAILDDAALAQQIADTLVASCPIASADDEQARAQCAANLADNKSLGAVMQEPFLWGGQKAGTSYRLEQSPMGRFDVLAWRRMYLSLYMFTGTVAIEQTSGGFTVAHLGYQFRNELDIGAYPSPLGHSKKEWDSYQFSRDATLIIHDGKWIGAVRSEDVDPVRP